MACRLIGTKSLSVPMLENFNWTLRINLHWNFNWKSYIFIQENSFENAVCQMATILHRPQCVNNYKSMLLLHTWITNCERIRLARIRIYLRVGHVNNVLSQSVARRNYVCRPDQNGFHFANDIFQPLFRELIFPYFDSNFIEFCLLGPINNRSGLVLTMALWMHATSY